MTAGVDEDAGEDAALRIDAWLWRARFFKTRALASAFVEKGRVRLDRDGRTSKVIRASLRVRKGDILAFAKDERHHVVRVERLLDRRVGAPAARGAYSLLEDLAA